MVLTTMHYSTNSVQSKAIPKLMQIILFYIQLWPSPLKLNQKYLVSLAIPIIRIVIMWWTWMPTKCVQLIEEYFLVYFHLTSVRQRTDFGLQLLIQPKPIIEHQSMQNFSIRNGSPTKSSRQWSIHLRKRFFIF